jgi:uncharacterized alpha/beta hydrolase family protein
MVKKILSLITLVSFLGVSTDIVFAQEPGEQPAQPQQEQQAEQKKEEKKVPTFFIFCVSYFYFCSFLYFFSLFFSF